MGSSSSKPEDDNRCTSRRIYDQQSASGARVHHSSDFCYPEDLVLRLQPGDMVQKKGNWLPQMFYSPFAVYVGNGDVIHVGGKGNRWVRAERAPMVEIFAGELVRKNNTLDDVIPPQPRPRIVFDARKWLNEHWEYNAVTNNCEHFATLCRYGRKISLQALLFGDLVDGRISLDDYLYYNVGRSIYEQPSSLFRIWLKRKLHSTCRSDALRPNRSAWN